MEASGVGVLSDRPDEDDVMGEGAAVVRVGRDEDETDAPAVDGEPRERLDPRLRILGRAIDNLRVVGKRSRRGRDDEMLVGAGD